MAGTQTRPALPILPQQLMFQQISTQESYSATSQTVPPPERWESGATESYSAKESATTLIKLPAVPAGEHTRTADAATHTMCSR
jgi:hypothetical protein